MVSNHPAYFDYRLAVRCRAWARPLPPQLHHATLSQPVPKGPAELRAGEEGPIWIRIRDKLLPPYSAHSTKGLLLVGQGLLLVQANVHTVPCQPFSQRTFCGQVPIYANLIRTNPLLT